MTSFDEKKKSKFPVGGGGVNKGQHGLTLSTDACHDGGHHQEEDRVFHLFSFVLFFFYFAQPKTNDERHRRGRRRVTRR